MRKVMLIGGSSRTGKSTIAAYLSLKTGHACISTDDIGAIVQTITGIDSLAGLNYLDYYTGAAKNQLIEDMQAYHCALLAPINTLIQRHAANDAPLIIEGYALYPKDVSELPGDQVGRVWLVADQKLLKRRVLENRAFFRKAGDKRKVAENYLYRSLWHNKTIYEQCRFFNQPFVLVQNDDYDTITSQVAEVLLQDNS